MTLQMNLRIAAAVLCGLLAGAWDAGAQTTRFEAVSNQAVAALPGLQVLIVRDTVLNACYTLFVAEPAPAVRSAAGDNASVADATRARDQRMAELSAEYERGLSGAVPATLTANPLRFQSEATKIQGEYEHVLRQSEIGRLSEQLAQMAAAPRMAVAGPAPCSPAAAPPPPATPPARR